MTLPSVLDFAFAVAVTILVLALLDIFLSDRQKQWLHDRTVIAWNWLDDAKRTSLLDWLRRYYQAIALIGVVTVSIYLTWAFEKALAPLSQVIVVAVCIFLVGLWFGFKIIRTTLAASTLSRAVIRATLIAIATILPAFIFFAAVQAFNGDFVGFAKQYAAAVAHKLTIGLALFALFYLWALILIIHLTVIAVIFWEAAALPLSVLYLLSIILFCVEFIVRRIAEYPKPIVAGSAVCGAILGICRVLLASH